MKKLIEFFIDVDGLLTNLFKEHRDKWHSPEKCIFCHMSPSEQEAYFKEFHNEKK
jgi:hypothetical protein